MSGDSHGGGGGSGGSIADKVVGGILLFIICFTFLRYFLACFCGTYPASMTRQTFQTITQAPRSDQWIRPDCPPVYKRCQ